MKIGILTYHSVCNFGAQLQALSTVCFFKKRGIASIIINYYPNDLEDTYRKEITSIQYKAHEEFVSSYLPITKRCKTLCDVDLVIEQEKIDAVIIGSDAVLNYQTPMSRINIKKIAILPIEPSKVFPNPFWGHFSNRQIKKVMMSVSCQNVSYTQIGKKVRERMFNDLNSFSYISVRDDWTKSMIEYLSNGKITPEITPDPVFSFNSNFIEIPTKEEILLKYHIPDNYILISFKNSGKGKPSDSWIHELDRAFETKGFSLVGLPMPGGLGFNFSLSKSINLPLPPLDWYALIKYSKGYVGHNMHPIVVSLHNSVPFFSFDNYGVTHLKYYVKESSSKIYHILKKTGFFENRVCAATRFGFKEPSINTVVNAIENFNRARCDSFAKQLQSEYDIMMEKILKSIM